MSTLRTEEAVARTTAGAFSWKYFVSKSGSAGRSWVEDYERFRDADSGCFAALVALRKRDLNLGRHLLDRARALSCEAPDLIRWILERWVFGAEAYYHYCLDDFDRAELDLDRARSAVIRAVGAASFLLPLAQHCEDFELQKARCARQRREWEAMRRHIEAALDMATSRSPLCLLDGGRAIYAKAVEQFYVSLDLSPEERRAIEPLVDDSVRLREIDRSVRVIYLLPGFVIADP